MVENKEKIDEDSKVVENSSEDENIDSSEESEVVEKEKSAEIIEEEKDNIIYIGIKPFMNYVTGVVMQFQNKGQDEVIVCARGKFISKAVDVVEVARRTFLKDEDIKIKNIGINSEQFENKEGKRIFVSTIEIKLIKN